MKTPHLIVVLAFCTLSCVGQNPTNPPGTKRADTASAPPKAAPAKTKDPATKTKFSIGASEGKLGSVRSLLGFMATSLEINPQWSQRLLQIQKMQSDAYHRALARGYAQIQAAGQMSREISAQNDRFLQRIDAGLAANRAQQTASQGFTSGSNDDFYKNSDNYDQYIRGTEHMQDQYGQVTDQYSDYSYHWTDGFGRFVHTEDPNLDPNRYLIGNYERMTPVR